MSRKPVRPSRTEPQTPRVLKQSNRLIKPIKGDNGYASRGRPVTSRG